MSPHKFKVLFLLQRPEAWINFESVWHALSERNDFELSLLILPYNVSDVRQSKRMNPVLRSRLAELGIPYIEWKAGIRIAENQYDVVVFGHPYDRERPKEFWFHEVKKWARKTVYIPYGISMGGGRKNLRLQFSQPVQIHADAVIARSELERAQYERHCPSGSKHVRVLGYPRFDSLMKAIPSDASNELEIFRNGRTTLLWNSHFSFGPQHSQISNFSTFDLVAPEIFSATRNRQDRFCLIWRPHPSLIPELIRLGMLSEPNVEKLFLELKSIGVFLDQSADHTASFRASHALATDIGSFLLEYLTQKKPIISLINPDGEPLNSEAKLLTLSYLKAQNADEFIGFIDDLIEGRCEPPSCEIQDRHLPKMDGSSGIRVANLIARLAGSEKEIVPQEKTQPPKSDLNVLFPGFNSIINVTSTPVLDELCARLIDFRNIKKSESELKKKMRRIIKSARAEIVESIKRINPIMAALHKAGNLKSRAK